MCIRVCMYVLGVYVMYMYGCIQALYVHIHGT